MSRPIIEVKNVSKHYRLGAIGATSLREEFHRTWDRLRGRHSADPREFWALRDVSFEVQPGEIVGVIGRNGAGKSTLLKILSRITEPTSGRAVMRGRVASLLEVGTGFHPELSGRDNIFLNGAILGMTRAEVMQKFDEIVAFAEVDQFIDTPVKRYSSGMYVRLAFAVAAHLEPEILIIDEVLAVGDAAFQKKCLGKMQDVAKCGRTVLFVSHSIGAINNLTSRCAYLKAGGLELYDLTPKTIQKYYDDTLRASKEVNTVTDHFRRDTHYDAPLLITRIAVEGTQGAVPVVPMGSDVSIVIHTHAEMAINGANVAVKFTDASGTIVSTVFSWDAGFHFSCPTGDSKIVLRIPRTPFTPGRVHCEVGINQSTSTKAYDVIRDFPLFEVQNTGQVVHWPERPWGAVHLTDVQWMV